MTIFTVRFGEVADAVNERFGVTVTGTDIMVHVTDARLLAEIEADTYHDTDVIEAIFGRVSEGIVGMVPPTFGTTAPDYIERFVAKAKEVGMDQVFFNPDGLPNNEEVTFEIQNLKELIGIL